MGIFSAQNGVPAKGYFPGSKTLYGQFNRFIQAFTSLNKEWFGDGYPLTDGTDGCCQPEVPACSCEGIILTSFITACAAMVQTMTLAFISGNLPNFTPVIQYFDGTNWQTVPGYGAIVLVNGAYSGTLNNTLAPGTYQIRIFDSDSGTVSNVYGNIVFSSCS